MRLCLEYVETAATVWGCGRALAGVEEEMSGFGVLQILITLGWPIAVYARAGVFPARLAAVAGAALWLTSFVVLGWWA